ncbi:MAG TPA: 50S ribosomal protein L25/general stress protein Ctc [Solimonas sp.]|nr:50S ribosomal protein L25/general stress protein Ctc [Solimonas sp.]
MKENFVVIAESRNDQGKGASRRLRRTGKVPAIVYGGKDKPASVTVSHNEMWKSLKAEAFYSHILTLRLDGKEQQVVLKDLQRHPVDETLLHIDFQRILADQILRRAVPLHFKGAEVAPGVKIGGGIIEHHVSQVDVECLPKDLPEYLEIDLSGMQLNDVIHLSQIKLPEGVTLAELKHGNDASAVALHLPRAAAEPEPTVAAAVADVPAANQKAPDAKAGAAAPKGAAPKGAAPKAAAPKKK